MKMRKIAVSALSFAMVMTMGVSSVFAAGTNSGKNGGVESYAADEAKLVKYLTAAEGLTLPEETFKFTFTPVAPAEATNMTVPADSYGQKTVDIAVGSMESASVEGTQNKTASKAISEIFTKADFSRAGEYTYKVAETEGSTAGMTYSKDEYTLRLIVDKDGNIDDVTVENKDGEKTDPTDVDPTDNEGGATPDDSNGGFTFTNKFSKNVNKHDEPKDPNPDPDPEDPNNPNPIDETETTKDVPGAFVLDKFVLGEYGDQTKDFDFNVTVVLPAGEKDFTLTDGFVDGEAKKVSLKHGGKYTFAELPVGTKIKVEEADYSGQGYKAFMTTSEENDATEVLVGENGGYAICRNSFADEEVTPTGIVINNLPYILLIAIALGGIVMFTRKRRYE